MPEFFFVIIQRGNNVDNNQWRKANIYADKPRGKHRIVPEYKVQANAHYQNIPEIFVIPYFAASLPVVSDKQKRINNHNPIHKAGSLVLITYVAIVTIGNILQIEAAQEPCE